MGTLTNNTSEKFELRMLSCEIGPGETIDAPDQVLAENMFAYPNFLVNGKKRVGPWDDVEDFSDPKYLASDDSPAPPVVAPPVTPDVPADNNPTE